MVRHPTVNKVESKVDEVLMNYCVQARGFCFISLDLFIVLLCSLL